MHRALAAVQDAGRLGDRKVFIASLWAMMLHIEAQTGSTLTDGASLEHFKAWLLRSLRITRDGTGNDLDHVMGALRGEMTAMEGRFCSDMKAMEERLRTIRRSRTRCTCGKPPIP